MTAHGGVGDDRRPFLVWCAGVHWDAIRGTDRHLVTAMSERADVLWVDPPLSIVRRFRPGGLANTGRGLQLVAPGITRLTVLVVPFGSRRHVQGIVAAMTRRAIRRATRRVSRRTQAAPCAMVVALPEPFFGALPDARLVYFATDDFTSGASLLGLDASRLRERERQMVEEADLLVGVTDSIVNRWPSPKARHLVLPNGCVLADDPSPMSPRDVGIDTTSPLATVIGQFSPRIDLSLLEAVARSGAHLLLVGPHDPSFEPARFAALTALPNVDWVGQQPYERIASYLRATTVGLTPYVDSAFNRASFPLKTLEYLAAGRPVVSTPLPAADHLNTRHVTQAAGPAAFADAVLTQLRAGLDPDEIAERLRFAAGHTWQARAARLLDALVEMEDQ